MFGSALTRACHEAPSGTISVAMQLVGSASSHVLLAVSYNSVPAPSSELHTDHRRERAMFSRRGSTVVPGILVSEPASLALGAGIGAASGPNNVGLAALPPHIAHDVVAALSSGSAYESSPGFRMHSLVHTSHTTPTISTRSATGTYDLEPFAYGHRVSLPASAQIVNALGGHVGLRQEALATQFWMLLPVVEPAVPHKTVHAGDIDLAAQYSVVAARRDAGASETQVAAFGPAANTETQNLIESAIVVDDEATLRRLAERMVVRAGLRCVALEDGSELADAIEPGTGLVLLDIVMKRSDGVQVRVARSRVRGLR